MGQRSRAMASRRRIKKASALAAGGSGLSPVFRCLPADKGEQVEAASEGGKILMEAASEEGKILKHESEESGDRILVEAPASEEVKILKHESEEDEEGDKMLKLDSLVLEPEQTLEDRKGRILMLDSEEDCKILMKVKSEEGKILKLRKEYAAATEVALAAVSHHIAPTFKPAEPEPAGKKKMKVVKTLVPPLHIALIKAMPCPVTTPEFYVPDSYYESEEDLNISRTMKLINIKMRDYHQALVDQYDKFGFAVDEEELTDNEDEDNMVKN